jgi:hypothetical protein
MDHFLVRMITIEEFEEACRRGDKQRVNQTWIDLLKSNAVPYVLNKYLELMTTDVDVRLRPGIFLKLASSEETLDEAIVFFDRYSEDLNTRACRTALLLQLAESRITPERVEVIRRLIQQDVSFEVFEKYLGTTKFWLLKYPDIYQTLLSKFYPHLKKVVESMIELEAGLPLVAILKRFGDIVHNNLQAWTNTFRPHVLDQWVRIMIQYEADLIPMIHEALSEVRLNALREHHVFLTDGLQEVRYPYLEGVFTYDALKYWVDRGRVLHEPRLMDHIKSSDSLMKDKYKVWALLVRDERVRRRYLSLNPDLKAYVQRVYAYAERGVNNQMPRGVPLSLQRYLM